MEMLVPLRDDSAQHYTSCSLHRGGVAKWLTRTIANRFLSEGVSSSLTVIVSFSQEIAMHCFQVEVG